MMKRAVLIILLLMIVTGCWNRKELDQISLATAIGIDKQGDHYNISVQLLNSDEITSSKGVGQRQPVVTLQISSGSTIFESFRKLTTSSPRKILSSHLRILVLGEELAGEGISKVLDILSRDHELRSDFNILLARNATANDILQVLTPLEKIPANKLYTSLVSSEKNWGVTTNVDLHQLIYDLVDPGKDPVLSSIHIKGDVAKAKSRENLNSVLPPATLEYKSLGVFHKDQFVGWLTDRESKGYNYALGNLQSTVVALPCQAGGKMSIELMSTRSKLRARFVDQQPQAFVNVRVEANIGEVACQLNLDSTFTIQTIEEQLNEEIKQSILDAVSKAKSYKADIFGFGSAIHRDNYKQWNLLKNNWDQAFIDLPVQVTVQSRIRRTGSVVESFIDQME
ncbi:Ger(x)C family spore germination protein [Paenibacillus qinlingensis]|uniref:Ger(x)C family spore germination protein n=1 Tax=Paenibacillus qinlingensis TaxID=1837343 RepID=UPI00156629FE|nr:Ger(x)C family spore germination protein [Paenibacillus qinlingensis]NQX61411.1 Ger(x)C family spore germination protein [Paenibacillus qinlingensis]